MKNSINVVDVQSNNIVTFPEWERLLKDRHFEEFRCQAEASHGGFEGGLGQALFHLQKLHSLSLSFWKPKIEENLAIMSQTRRMNYREASMVAKLMNRWQWFRELYGLRPGELRVYTAIGIRIEKEETGDNGSSTGSWSSGEE